jgi:hypothetical protein
MLGIEREWCFVFFYASIRVFSCWISLVKAGQRYLLLNCMNILKSNTIK